MAPCRPLAWGCSNDTLAHTILRPPPKCKGGGCSLPGAHRREEVEMTYTVDAYCALVYGAGWDKDEKSKKSKRDTVSRMCRDKVLECRKVGKRWLIEL